MTNYSFREILGYIGEKLNASPPKEDLLQGDAEIVIEDFHVILTQGLLTGSIHMQLTLGFLSHPFQLQHLKDLICSNYLGVNTGGCHLALHGNCLNLHAHISSGTPPFECWQWLDRLICVARVWDKNLKSWEEFVSLSKETTYEPI